MPRRTIHRRAALGQMVAIGALAATGRSRAADPPMTATVRLDEPIGTIRPEVYGHFTEHIGGVIYDGIWVGPDSRIANVDGIRAQLVEAMKPLGRTVIRWPGGCFADAYDWRDGIGPRDRRPRRFGRWREETESNQFGTHEFMKFCRLTGCEPYFAANVGAGTVTNFQQWVEYCNAPAGATTLADERGANGDEKPFGVRYWGVGNESWGCGGKFTPEDYCREYRKFTEWVPGYGVPLYLIAAGPNGNDVEWTRRFFAKWADYAKAPIQGWAPHYYCGTTGHALKFTQDQWYEQLHKANRMEKLVNDQWAALGEFDKDHKIKLIVDEWGSWHPEGTEINKRHLFEQMGTQRDALVAALTLDTFNRHAEKVDMANVAQLINNLHSLFLADEDRFVATPSYHVFAMYRPHQGARAVRMEVQAPDVSFRDAMTNPTPLFRVAGSASLAAGRATITLVHTHATEPAELAVKLRGGSARLVHQTTLAHKELNAHNTFDRPDEVTPETRALDVRGDELRVTLPPASVCRFDVALA